MEDSIQDSQFNENLLPCCLSHTTDQRIGHRVASRSIPHISVDMLLGWDIPHFRKLLKEALEEESSIKPETNSSSEETKEETRIQTSLVTTRAQLDRYHLQDLQEQKEQEDDEPVIHSVDSDSPDGEGEEASTITQLNEVDPCGRLSRNLLRWRYSMP